MPGIIGKKVGMTSIFDASGKNIPCTIIEAGPCFVTQIKTIENDGYNAVQIAFDDKKEKNTTKAMKAHFEKANLKTPKRKIVEFKSIANANLGDQINVDVFKENEFVDVIGIAKGKGFQGVVKRYGFAGVGGQTHGQHNRLRAPGSLGASSYPSKVMKGMRMGGRMGSQRITTFNLKVIKVIPENNLLVVKGSLPGAKGAYLLIEK